MNNNCGTPERGVVYAWEGEVEGLHAEIERLRAALKPFATAYTNCPAWSGREQVHLGCINGVEVEDFRAAYNALEQTANGTQE